MTAVAWVMAVSAVCACITSVFAAYFRHERKLLQMRYDQKNADQMVTPEVVAMRTAEAQAQTVQAELDLYKIRRY